MKHLRNISRAQQLSSMHKIWWRHTAVLTRTLTSLQAVPVMKIASAEPREIRNIMRTKEITVFINLNSREHQHVSHYNMKGWCNYLWDNYNLCNWKYFERKGWIIKCHLLLIFTITCHDIRDLFNILYLMSPSVCKYQNSKTLSNVS